MEGVITAKRARFITVLCWLSLMSYGLCISLAGPAIGAIQRHFGVTEGSVGLIFTAQSIGFLSTVLFGGYLVSSAGIRACILAGQAAMTAGLALFALAGNFPLAVAAYALTGAAGGLIEITANTLVSDLHPDNRVSSLNILHLFFGAGALTGPLLSGSLVSQDSGPGAPYLAAAVYSALMLFLLAGGGVPAQSAADAEKPDMKLMLSMLKSRTTLLLGLATICYVGAEMGVNGWSVLYMERDLHMERITASAFLSNFWLAMTLGRIVCAALGKKLGEKNLLLVLSLAAFICYALFLFSPLPTPAGIGLVCTGLAFSGVFPAFLAIGGNAWPRATGAITGVVMSFTGIGFMIVPLLVGIVSSSSSLYTGMRMLMALLAGLIIIAAVLRRIARGR